MPFSGAAMRNADTLKLDRRTTSVRDEAWRLPHIRSGEGKSVMMFPEGNAQQGRKNQGLQTRHVSPGLAGRSGPSFPFRLSALPRLCRSGL